MKENVSTSPEVQNMIITVCNGSTKRTDVLQFWKQFNEFADRYVSDITLNGSAMVNWNRRLLIWGRGWQQLFLVLICALDLQVRGNKGLRSGNYMLPVLGLFPDEPRDQRVETLKSSELSWTGLSIEGCE